MIKDKFCSHCGDQFVAKYDNVKLCWTCFRKRDQALADYDDLLQEIGRLQAQCQALKDANQALEREVGNLQFSAMMFKADLEQERARHHAGAPIPKPMLQRLIRLAHPDKHGGSQLANEATTWLLQQRRMSA